MAKKKSNKKQKDKKKKSGKKKLLKLKLKKKKDAGKKEGKLKEGKKKAEKKKAEKKEKKKETSVVHKSIPSPKVEEKGSIQKAPAVKKVDHSKDYNAPEAVRKLRMLKSKEALLAFTKGEKRVTVTRIIPAALNRLK